MKKRTVPNAQARIDHVASLVKRHFAVRNGQLLIGSIPIEALAEEYGTPFFVYDRHVIDDRLRQLRKWLPKPFRIFYSIKANPCHGLLKFFVSDGCGLEVASGGELLQDLAAGCPPQSILFAGPGKTDRELRLALSREIGEIHVESLGEARRLDRISRERGRTSRIALRINPNEQAQGGAMRMGGKAAPFGIDEEHLPEILNEMAALPNLEVAGVHLYAGTQILDPKILLAQYGKAVGLAEQVAALLNRALRTIDFGGGLGIPYFPHERELDLGDFGPQLRAIVTRVESTLLLSKARLIIEPGRYLIGECGLYVSSITDIKLSRGKKFMLLDGGMHHHLAASGNLGQPIKRNFPIAVLNRLNSESKETVDVVGPLCTPLDVLGRSILLPVAEVGDLVGVFQSGAYARSASPLGFLSHPAPPEIWVGEGSSQLLRRRGEAADLMLGQERNVGIER